MPRTFAIDHHLPAQLPQIYQSVLDMRHFGKYHPYMREVTLLQSNSEYAEYEIKEMIWLFGFIPQWPRYTAKVFEKEKHKHIQYTSNVKGSVDLVIDFHFSEGAGNSTSVTEKIDLNGNALFTAILLGAMKKAHVILFNRLGQNLPG